MNESPLLFYAPRRSLRLRDEIRKKGISLSRASGQTHGVQRQRPSLQPRNIDIVHTCECSEQYCTIRATSVAPLHLLGPWLFQRFVLDSSGSADLIWTRKSPVPSVSGQPAASNHTSRNQKRVGGILAVNYRYFLTPAVRALVPSASILSRSRSSVRTMLAGAGFPRLRYKAS